MQDAAATFLDLPPGTLIPPEFTFLPCCLLLVRLPVLLSALPAAGLVVLQVGPGAQVQAAVSELRELGLDAELPGLDILQSPGLHLPTDSDALVPEARLPA